MGGFGSSDEKVVVPGGRGPVARDVIHIDFLQKPLKRMPDIN